MSVRNKQNPFFATENHVKKAKEDKTKSEILNDAFSPASLFASGETGVWCDPSDLTTLFQDSAGTTPVTAPGQFVGLVLDKSPNGANATQPTAAARPTYLETPSRIALDKVDDNMIVNFGAAFTGSVMQGTPRGVLLCGINVPNGVWTLATSQQRLPDGGEITGLIAVDRVMTAGEISNTELYLQANGAGENFAGVTSMAEWFRSRTDVTAIYSGNWDTSSVTNFSSFARDATSLTIIDVSNWDTSSVTNFGSFARGAASLTTLDVSNWDTSNVTDFSVFARDAISLTTLDVSNWDTSSVTNFGDFARRAISLTTLDVSNWDTSSVTNFSSFADSALSLTTVIVNGGTGNPFADSPCTNYSGAFNSTNLTQQSIDDILVAINSAGTSGGTFNQSDGSAPSATGEAAVTALRGRGWTVTVTGGF